MSCVNELPSVALTQRDPVLCEHQGSQDLVVKLVAVGRGTGVPGLPETDDWTTWDAGQIAAAVEYLVHLRVVIITPGYINFRRSAAPAHRGAPSPAPGPPAGLYCQHAYACCLPGFGGRAGADAAGAPRPRGSGNGGMAVSFRYNPTSTSTPLGFYRAGGVVVGGHERSRGAVGRRDDGRAGPRGALRRRTAGMRTSATGCRWGAASWGRLRPRRAAAGTGFDFELGVDVQRQESQSRPRC